MSGGTGEEHVPGEARPDSSAAYREDSDHFVLANPHLRLGLSAADGTILSLEHRQTETELIDADEAAALGFLWRLEIAREGGRVASVTSRDCTEFTHSVGRHRHRGEARLWLQWRGFRVAGSEVPGSLTVQITFPPDSAEVVFEEEIELPEQWSVRSLALPCLTAVGSADLLAEDAIFLPLFGGVLLPEPRGLARGAAQGRWQATYPGPASMQLFGYCVSERATLWLSSRDPSGSLKHLVASSIPGSARLAFWVTHYPSERRNAQVKTGYPTAVGIAAGDWFEAAREYRRWAVQQPWAARGRGAERRLSPLASSYGLWASYWGGAERCVSVAREVQRLVSAPVKLDWRCWHECGRDGRYPDYLPPRDGEEALAGAMRELADSGVLAQAGFSGLLASRQSRTWAQERVDAHVLETSGEAGGKPPRQSDLVAMCPETPYWREKLAYLAAEVGQRGFDGVLLEDIGTAPAMQCASSAHAHHTDGAAQWTTAVRGLLKAVRTALGDQRQLAIEGPSEPFLAAAHAFFSNQAALEREALLGDDFGRRWEPIPLFASVYHDYATLVGPGVSLVTHRPHDPLWSAAAIKALQQPPAVMGREFADQFCLEAARGFAWGQQAYLDGFALEQGRDERNRRKLAFLSAGMRAQAWGVAALLPQSRFLGMLDIACRNVELALLVNARRSTPADRRVMSRSAAPVLGTAYRTPGGSFALVLVNILTQPTEFTARLRSSRLSVQLPIRLVGRTFSEDGDTPAASLHASGMEIRGRLPARSVSLISLR